MKYPSYRYPVEKLTAGCSLGNYYLFVRFDAETNAKGVWCADDNQYYLGEWNTTIELDGIPLEPEFTEFFPESQTTTYSHDGVVLTKLAFLPFFLEDEADRHINEMHSLIYLFHMKNESSRRKRILISHKIHFPACRSALFVKQPPEDQIRKRVRITRQATNCEIATEDSEKEVRIFSSPVAWETCKADRSSLSLEYEQHLETGEDKVFPCILVISHEGIEKARHALPLLGDPALLLEKSVGSYRALLARSALITPEPMINRGIQWAKINTVRVQHRYKIGGAFTNDPPQDIIVIRDLAWYVLGSDYVTPLFSRGLLSLAERFAFHDGGKLTEYIHANEPAPEKHDYGLNINDDTPLYVYALHHHACTAGNIESWNTIYPLMCKASEWIISQLRDGLVHCHADGVQVWGICGWRNIIDNYTLSGAVTEVNSECFYALKCTADVARQLGRDQEAQRYSSIAGFLKTTINDRLVSEKTGMYVLNVDSAGVSHHDVTGDLIFPVMFGVADEMMSKRILDRLTQDELWTHIGSRSVSQNENGYDPDFGYQLMGGIWHNLTAWTAYCVRRDNPDRMVEGMKNIYRLPEIETPREYDNVVPGQFPERMHGETFASRGMALSPWMPPTYLWLGIEGLLGVKASPEGLEISPCIPEEWKWVAVKNLPWRGGSVTVFLFEGILYSSLPVHSSFPVKIGALINTFSENDRISIVGLEIDKELILFAASDEKADGIIRIRTANKTIDQRVELAAGEGVLIRIPAVDSSSYMDDERMR